VPYHLQLQRGLFGLIGRTRFNLDAATLVGDFIEPWLAGQAIVFDGRQWLPASTKPTVREGPALTSGQLSMGRGWVNAIEFCEDVTPNVLTEQFCWEELVRLCSLLGRFEQVYRVGPPAIEFLLPLFIPHRWSWTS
jgi:hypothetical protein